MCDPNWAESIDRTATGRYSCRISVMSARGRTAKLTTDKHYAGLVRGIGDLLEAARRTSARAVNALMTATYWEVGRRIVEFEQGGKRRAKYGEELLKQLSADLTGRFGRGFGIDNLQRFRAFYLAYSTSVIYATPSRKFPIPRSLSRDLE